MREYLVTRPDFRGDGLTVTQPAVIVAVAAHRETIELRLRERGFTLPDLVADGRLVMRDAHDLLKLIMRNGEPVGLRFDEAVEPLIVDASRAGNGVARVYGEMVDVLWRSGDSPRGPTRRSASRR